MILNITWCWNLKIVQRRIWNTTEFPKDKYISNYTEIDIDIFLTSTSLRWQDTALGDGVKAERGESFGRCTWKTPWQWWLLNRFVYRDAEVWYKDTGRLYRVEMIHKIRLKSYQIMFHILFSPLLRPRFCKPNTPFSPLKASWRVQSSHRRTSLEQTSSL